MAKQIKVVKCPQCGNSKPTSIGDQHYRCTKCGVEFFLDNDDQNINVNVNHNYGKQNYTPNKQNNTSTIITTVISVVFVIFLILFFAVKSCVSNINKNYKNRSTTTSYTEQNKKNKSFIQILYMDQKAVAFYLEKRTSRLSSKDSDKNGWYAVFYDIKKGDKIKEEKISEETINIKIDHRYFESNQTHYFILNYQLIYAVNTKNYTFQNVTNEIASAKPALNSGFSTIYFIPEKNGDGFRLTTNLGKEFIYFPTLDMLCTDRAFKHLTEGGITTLNDSTKNEVYYLFLNKDSKQSSNVAQLMQISFQYNHGGPQTKLESITSENQKFADKYRILSVKPISEERICFNPKILYFDHQYILISYRATLAEDATTHIQLLDTEGKINWTTSFTSIHDYKNTIKTDSSFILQSSDDKLYEISIDGNKKNSYSIK